MLREESDEGSKCGDELFSSNSQQKKRNLRSEVTYSICWFFFLNLSRGQTQVGVLSG